MYVPAYEGRSALAGGGAVTAVKTACDLRAPTLRTSIPSAWLMLETSDSSTASTRGNVTHADESAVKDPVTPQSPTIPTVKSHVRVHLDSKTPVQLESRAPGANEWF